MTKQRLIELIERKTIQSKLPELTQIVFPWEKEDSDSKEYILHKIFNNLPEDDRFFLTRDILELWCSEDEESAEKVFGNTWGNILEYWRKHIPLIATLTGDRKQLRFWVNKAGSVDIDHCDSCGDLYLLQVYNNQMPRPYIDLASELIAKPFHLPNNGLVFGKGNEPNLPKYWRRHVGDRHEINYESLKH